MSGNSTRDLVEVNEDDVSYFKEMLGSSLSKLGIGAALAAVIPAAIVGGPGLGLFPLLVAAGGTAIAGLFVPSSPVFRHRVNRRIRSEKREDLRQRFLARLAVQEGRTEVAARLGGMSLLETEHDLSKLEWSPLVEGYRPDYLRMVDRLQTLVDLAEGSDSGVTPEEVEKLQDATVDYLRLVYARMNLLERLDTSRQDEVDLRIAELTDQIENAPPALQARLERAREDLIRTKAHVAQIPARDAAVAAQLLHMAETFEELYHRITADPASNNVSGYLSEATEKMSIEEELQWAAEAEVAEMQDRRRRAMGAAQKG